MNNKRATKRALLTSVMALVMCVVMLVGTTFAWFTDTASTGVNKIQAGNLDIELVNEAGTTPLASATALKWKTVDTGKVLWEPNCKYDLEGFQIKNAGNLAVKYKVVLKATDITKTADGKSLLDVIDWTIKLGGTEVTTVTSDMVKNGLVNGVEILVDKVLAPESLSGVISVTGHMDSNAGNDYQGLEIGGFGITVLATQATYEKDSISDQYDAEAKYPEVDAANLADTLNSLADNAVITVNGTVNTALTISKPVTIHNLTATAPVTIASNGVTLNAANIEYKAAKTPALVANSGVKDVTITNSIITAATGKTGSHTAVSLPVSGKVVFTGNTVTNDYNGVEFGLNVPTADGTVIENNNFINIGNNAVSIYQVADGATVTIKNNTFSGVKGKFIPIRLSNSNNMTGTFVISDNKADTDNAWENCFVMLEDYSKAGAVQDFTKYALKFSNNTVGTKCTYTVVYDDDSGFISTNQPRVEK